MSQFPAIVQLANLIDSKEFSDRLSRTVAYNEFTVNDVNYFHNSCFMRDRQVKKENLVRDA
jgi:hypothetical protein